MKTMFFSLPPWPYLFLLPLLEVVTTTNCPSPCQCKWLEGKYTLDCVETNITRFPLTGDNIEAIILDKNDFSKLEAFEFVNSGLSHVRKVSMKSCNLDKFEDDLFSGLTNLHGLDLSHNMLTQLSRHQFPSLPELRSLDLSQNYLRSVHKDSFSNVGTNLVRVDLSGNSLISIPWTTFIPLPNLKQLSLGGNPWHCDCRLGELHSELVRKAIVPAQATCSTPRALSSKHWANFHSKQFTCSPTVSLPHPSQHAVQPGQLVPLHCQVSGNPSPSVTWRQNGYTMPEGNQDTYSIRQTKSGEGHSTDIFSVLTIRNMSSFALGTYSCLAKNKVGIDEKEIRISFHDVAQVFDELEDKPVLLIVGISAATVIIVIITLMLVIICCIRRFRDGKSRTSSHSSSFTILDYKDTKPTKDLDLFRPSWTNPMPKPPRTGAYDKMSCEDIPGTLSRSSTRQTYLLADPCDGDTSHLSVDGYDSATLPRSDTDWTRHEKTVTAPYPTDTLLMLPPFCNQAGSRASVGTISTIDPIYGTVRRTLPPQYAYAPHYPAMPSVCHSRPGYVTLPRRPKISRRPALPLGDSLGPRSSADGCSHSNIASLPMNMSFDHQCKSTMLPPYSPPPPASITAINTVGLPPVQIPSPEEDPPMRTSTPKTAPDLSPPSSRALLDTILEQD